MSLFFFLAAQAVAPPPIDGRWINPARTVIIVIAPCGDRRCGTVAWASADAKAAARKAVPNLVGTALLTGLKQRDATHWRGRLFVPDRNVRASARIELVGADQLKVSGCALGGILCDSQRWTRMP